MKHLLLIPLVLFCINASAQLVTGIVIDKNTRKPVEYVIVAASTTNTMTSDQGSFTLKITKVTDTLRIKTMGYKTYTQPVSPWSGRLKMIELEPQSIKLNEVAIVAKRNYLRDSVKRKVRNTVYSKPCCVTNARTIPTNVLRVSL